MNLIKNFKDMKKPITINFDKQGIIESLKKYDTSGEWKYMIYDTHENDLLSQEDQKEIINDLIESVENLTENDITIKYVRGLKTKANGRFRKGSVNTIFNVNISNYVNDFTNCWYHDRLVLRAIDESTLTVTLEKTQTTH